MNNLKTASGIFVIGCLFGFGIVAGILAFIGLARILGQLMGWWA